MPNEQFFRGLINKLRVGDMQTVGNMQVIPIVGRPDGSVAAPRVRAGTRNYGSVDFYNDEPQPTIVPPGSAFITKQYAQDHGISKGRIVPANGHLRDDEAMCIQDTQGGLISAEDGILTILPARVRSRAMTIRGKEYNRLWPSLRQFSKTISSVTGKNVSNPGWAASFLDTFKSQLDVFMAQFECVPDQCGAIVLVNGKIAGVEVAPNPEYWAVTWEPLIRVTYGSLAMEKDGDPLLPELRIPQDGTPEQIAQAMEEYRAAERKIVIDIVEKVETVEIKSTPYQTLDSMRLNDVASDQMVGTVGFNDGDVNFVSMFPRQL